MFTYIHVYIVNDSKFEATNSSIVERADCKGQQNVRWDEIMRIASIQVVVTAKVETADGRIISIRQGTEAESKLADICSLLNINSKPLGKKKIHATTKSNFKFTRNLPTRYFKYLLTKHTSPFTDRKRGYLL